MTDYTYPEKSRNYQTERRGDRSRTLLAIEIGAKIAALGTALVVVACTSNNSDSAKTRAPASSASSSGGTGEFLDASRPHACESSMTSDAGSQKTELCVYTGTDEAGLFDVMTHELIRPLHYTHNPATNQDCFKTIDNKHPEIDVCTSLPSFSPSS